MIVDIRRSSFKSREAFEDLYRKAWLSTLQGEDHSHLFHKGGIEKTQNKKRRTPWISLQNAEAINSLLKRGRTPEQVAKVMNIGRAKLDDLIERYKLPRKEIF